MTVGSQSKLSASSKWETRELVQFTRADLRIIFVGLKQIVVLKALYEQSNKSNSLNFKLVLTKNLFRYEHKKYIAREWVPPVAVKVDWDKEIEEEIENLKRKKKTTGVASIPEPSKPAPSSVHIVIPAPLPKPHSPKNSKVEVKKAVTVPSSSADLLGIGFGAELNPVLSVPKPAEIFDFFANVPLASPVKQQIANGSTETNNSLKQEEHDFFNQKSLENGGNEKGKMTKQSILALYGTAPTFSTPAAQAQVPFNGSFQAYPSPRPPQESFLPFGQPPPAPVGNFGNFNANFATVQTQQMNKLNEENIKKIESLNFNNFK